MENKTEQAILRPQAAARFLGVSVQTIYRLAAAGKLPRPLRISARASGWRLADLQAFIDAAEQKTVEVC